jgi:serine phosphatase RsbU (regulator of sigma subunit)
VVALRIFIITLLLVCSYGLSAQFLSPHITTYTPKAYGTLKAPEVWSIAQDERGLMYFGMANEIAVFDGVSWSFIPVDKAFNITSICVYKGNVYYGGAGQFGVVDYDQTGKRVGRSLSGEFEGTFTNVWKCFAHNEKVYFQSFQGLFVYENGKTTVIKGENDFHLSFINQGEIYLREKKVGLHQLKNDKLSFIPGSEAFANEGLCAVLPGKDNAHLFMSFEIGVWQLNNSGQLTPYCPDSCLNTKSLGIYGGVRLQKGGYALNSIHSGLIFTDDQFTIIGQLNSELGLPSDEVKTIFEDRNGKLWIGTGYGIACIEAREPIHFFDQRHGIVGNVQSVNYFNNHYLIGTSVGLFRERRPGSFQFDLTELRSQVWDMTAVGDQLFVATDNGLLISKDGSTFSKRYSGKYHALYYDAENMLLLASGDRNISCLDEFSDWQIFQIYEHNGQQTTAMAYDPTNNCVWIGTFLGGVIRARFDGFEYIFDQYGANEQEEQGLRTKELITPFSLGNSALFGTPYNLLRFVNEQEAIEQLKSIGEWHDSLINYPKFYGGSFAESPHYNIGSSNNYQQILELGELVIAAIDNKLGYFIDNEFITTPFASIEVGRINTLYNKDGWLFIGGAEGIAAVNLEELLDEKHQSLPTYITTNFRTIRYNDSLTYTPYFENTALAIPYYRNSISISFASTGIENGIPASYSWRLVEDDENWSAWTNQTTVEFKNLFEGDYTFEVKSLNVFGDESEVSTFHFTIIRPWYRSVWAYLAYFIFLAIVVYVAILLGRKRLKAQNIWLEGVVEERTAEIREKKSELEKSYHEIAEQKQEITDSINYAQRIQRAILPVEETIKKHIPDYFVLFMPKDIVSGDFYWFAHSHEHTIFVCADCTGHGVPGAFMSMIGSDKLNQAVLEKGHVNPADIISFLNVGIKTALKQDETSETATRDGMDVTVIAINEEKTLLKVAAANNGLMRIRNNEIEDFKATKKAVGGFTPLDQNYELTEIAVQPGDCFYMTTDGYPDQFGGDRGKKLKIAVLKQVLLDIHQKPMEEQREFLKNYMHEWMQGHEQIDDICVIGVRL